MILPISLRPSNRPSAGKRSFAGRHAYRSDIRNRGPVGTRPNSALVSTNPGDIDSITERDWRSSSCACICWQAASRSEQSDASSPGCRSRRHTMPTAGAQVAAHPFLQLRGEALDPAVHGRVIHRDAPVGEHPLEVAVADRELQVPAHGPKDHLGREAKAAECAIGVDHERYSRRNVDGSTVLTRARRPAQCNKTSQRLARTAPL